MLWVFIILIALITITGLGISFNYTRRAVLGEVHTPQDYGLEFEPVEFKAKDGLTLRGVWIPAPGSDQAIILLHGFGGSYDPDIYRVTALHEAGFNALLFDFRAHGRSDGNFRTLGYKERWDVLGAVDFLHQRDVKHIGLLGFSYGGMVAMLTTPICPEIEAMITDGGPARWQTAGISRAVEIGLPLWLGKFLVRIFLGITSLRMGANLYKYEPIRWVEKISPRPILFIHGDQDQYLPDFNELYAAAREPKELWRLAEAGHTTASSLYPEEYSQRVIDFFKRHMR
jgi:pimeloyl-ACP methyl ester carboxylesterase